MAQLNFPDPAVTQTYTEAGIVWTWNATLGVWSAEPGSGGGDFTQAEADGRYLRIDAAAPDQTRVSSRAIFNEDVIRAQGTNSTTLKANGVHVIASSNDADAFRAGVHGDAADNAVIKADGSAYFAGSTYIGGSNTRNTFELWKSTLTEEQLEQFEAGTFAVPANVSTPGDGEFARQWWYDQQDAETQAAIDSGDLDYPEHLAAATFTDTFALGDNTSINLSSTGSSLFRKPLTTSNYFAVAAEDQIGPNPITNDKTGISLRNNGQVLINVRDASAACMSLRRDVDGGFINFFNNSTTEINTLGVSNGVLNFSDKVRFSGLTEHAAGVNVTGGCLQVLSSSTNTLAAGNTVHIGISNNSVCNPVSAPNTNFFQGVRSDIDANNESLKSLAHYVVGNSSNAQACGAIAGFQVGSQISSGLPANHNVDVKGVVSNVPQYTGTGTGENYNFYAGGNAPSYFQGDITCDGLINGAFSLRMDTDDPAAFQTTYSTDDEGNQVESQEYIGTTEDLLSIIKDLRARVAALEAAQP